MKIGQEQQRQVLNLNNQAVAHLQAGQSKEAMTALRLAASILRDRFPAASRDEEQENSSNNNTSTSTSSAQSQPATTNPTQRISPQEEETSCQHSNMDVEGVVSSEEHPQPQTATTTTTVITPLVHSVPAHLKYNNTSSNNKNSASFSFYNRALVVPSLNKNNAAADAEILSGVILYNMGLVNHLHGLSRGLDAFLDQALRLYQTGLTIMQACYNEGMDHGNDDDDDDNNNTTTVFTMEQEEAHFQSTSFILLALFNNSAQIYSHYCQRDGMSYSLDCMRQVLGASSPAGQNFSSMALQQEQQQQHDQPNVGNEYQSYSFFYMNAMVFSSVDSLALAAAA